MQALGRRQSVELAAIEGSQDILNKERRDTMNELFFMADKNRVQPSSPESFSHWALVEPESTRQQNGPGNTGAVVEPLN